MTNFAEGGLPSERHAYYYAERAKGGCGLIITEEQSVHPTDHAYEKLICAYDKRVIPRYRKIVQMVHEYGAKIFAQLNHNGAQCDGSWSRLPVWAPSPVPDVLFREIPKEMEEEDIEEVLCGFYQAALNVREGGFDGIEIQASHSSLIRQFLSPLSNMRKDGYGGDLKGRMRFLLEVIERVRNAVGDDYTVGVRICGDEMIPGGLTLEDMKEVARRLEETKMVDFINISLGTFYNLYLVEGSMHTPLGFSVHLSSGIKKVVNLPVFACGRINSPVQAEKILQEGHADVIGMVRALICDPHLPRKAQEGRIEEIRYCVADNQGCIGRMGVNKPLSCIQNPDVGYEKKMALIKKAERKKRVMVIGGGPAGMEAARVAALRGHEVVLYEKEEELGGQVNIAKRGAGREEIEGVVRYLASEIRRLKVDIRLKEEITEEFVLKEAPDVVIVATGSYPIPKPVQGEYGPPDVLNVWQVLKEEYEPGKRILLIDQDGHHRATSTAEFLAERGREVTMLTSSLFVGQDLGPLQDLYLTLQRLMKKGVKFVHNVAVTKIEGKKVEGFNVYSLEPFTYEEADTIVLVMGQKANDSLYFSLKGKVENLYRIGDCVAPRKIDMAILEGNRVGRVI